MAPWRRVVSWTDVAFSGWQDWTNFRPLGRTGVVMFTLWVNNEHFTRTYVDRVRRKGVVMCSSCPHFPQLMLHSNQDFYVLPHNCVTLPYLHQFATRIHLWDLLLTRWSKSDGWPSKSLISNEYIDTRSRCYDHNFLRFCQISAKKLPFSQKPMFWSIFWTN
jgi:hypothetical protein